MATLAFLNGLNGEIQIGLVIADTVVPLIVGAVKDVKAFLNDQGQIEFSVAVTQGQADLAGAIADLTATLQEINAERAKANPPLPPITIPGV